MCAHRRLSLGIRPVWSESSLSAWRKLGSLTTHWASAQSDLRLCWAHSHFVGFVMWRLKCQMKTGLTYIDAVKSCRYANLLDLGNQRREKIKESCEAYQLVREAAELAAWITEKENIMVGEDVGEDLEQVEEMQKKFDDFRKVQLLETLFPSLSPPCLMRRVFCNDLIELNRILYRGSYTSGHFIWNLWNDPWASFINFIWNDHKCKFFLSYDCLKWDFITFKVTIISIENITSRTASWRYAPVTKCYVTCGHMIFMTRR